MLELTKPSSTRKTIETDFKFWPKERLEANLAKIAKKSPDKIAVVDPWVTLTYEELNSRINDLAVNMSEEGIGKNSIVMFQLPNIVESMIVFHATLRVGAVVLPVPINYREAEIQSIVDQVTPDLVFITDYFRKHNYVEMYEEMEKFKSTSIVRIKVQNELDVPSNYFLNWVNMVNNTSEIRLKKLTNDPYEYALLMFTSGTTSTPKGVLHTHGTLGVAISTFDGIETINSASIFFVPSPVTHITGVVMGILGPIKYGGKSILMPTWDSKKAFKLIKDEKCTYTMASTPFLSQLIDICIEKDETLSTLNYFACGGADVSEFLLKKAKKINPYCIFSRIYGSTEAPGISTFEKGYSESKRYSRDGRPTYPIKAKFKSEIDSEGELLVYGPQLFMRYLNWEETVSTLKEEWFETGDLAKIDEEGFIEITGREKDIIIRGGENYSAKEVEDILGVHANIEDIAIVGYPDKVMGERGCAFIVLKNKQNNIELNEITSMLEKKKIAKHKWPEKIEIVEEIPYTHSGKQQKYILRNKIKNKGILK